MKEIDIARVCHEANRAYCLALGDTSQTSWGVALGWQRDSALEGVKMHLDEPEASPSRSHECWLSEKQEAGWTYGPVKDSEKKEHPCMLPFKELPKEQQIKDVLFSAIVHALTELAEKEQE